MHLLFIMGPTNVGKSTLLKYLGTKPRIGLIEVGKMLRAKYGEAYFKGQAAPTHTATEAWQMMLDGIERHYQAGMRYAVIDGQPRDYQQCYDSIELPYSKTYVNLWATEESRTARAMARDKDNPAALELSLKRMRGDLPMLYNLLSILTARGLYVKSYETDSAEYMDDFNEEFDL